VSDEPDPALRALEAALEAERKRSRDADAELRDLSRRELELARGKFVAPSSPPSAAMPMPTSGWTVDTAMAHLLALRATDEKFYAERHRAEEKFQAERDRRLTEVAVEREKALKIKETADLAALQLAREIQTYKDEKANELREQISSERGLYATKDDLGNAIRELTATFKPALDYIATQRGQQEGSREAIQGSRQLAQDERQAAGAARAVVSDRTATMLAVAAIVVAIVLSAHPFG
jgi:hypothetical protein